MRKTAGQKSGMNDFALRFFISYYCIYSVSILIRIILIPVILIPVMLISRAYYLIVSRLFVFYRCSAKERASVSTKP